MQVIIVCSKLKIVAEKQTKMDKDEKNKQLADDIVYAGTQFAACTVLDLAIDPVINKYVQDKLAPSFKGQEVHARKAELAGDASASLIFIGLQKYFPGVVNSIKKAVKPLLDPIYEKIGDNRLQEWAGRHGIKHESKEFRDKLDEWKDQQAGNFAKTAVISGTSVITNVATQVALGNKRSIAVITAGKLVGATVTMGAVLGVRALAPRMMHKVDKRINKYVALPLISGTQKLFGVADAATAVGEEVLQTVIPQAKQPETTPATTKWADEKVQKVVSDAASRTAAQTRDSYAQMVGGETRDATTATSR